MNVLVHPLSSSYSSELTVHNTTLTSLRDCTLICDMYTEWVMTDQSEFGRQRKLNYHTVLSYVIYKLTVGMLIGAHGD